MLLVHPELLGQAGSRQRQGASVEGSQALMMVRVPSRAHSLQPYLACYADPVLTLQ